MSIVDCAHYRDGVRQHEGPLGIEEAAARPKGDGDFVWLGLHEPPDEEIEAVQGAFDLPELAVEGSARSFRASSATSPTTRGGSTRR
ncbi:MAG: hypothetical protein ACRDL1_06905 [Solirubrobacterales bacterium]